MDGRARFPPGRGLSDGPLLRKGCREPGPACTLASTLSRALGTLNKPSAVEQGEPRAGRQHCFRLQSRPELLVASECFHLVRPMPQAPWPSPKACPIRRQGARARTVGMPGVILPEEGRGRQRLATTPAGNPGIYALREVQTNSNEESHCLAMAHHARDSTQHFICTHLPALHQPME